MNCQEEVIGKLDDEVRAIKTYKEYLVNNFNELSNFFDKISVCEGNIVTIGVGKSEIIAKKTAATMNSLGVPAFNLNVLDALHGELNRINTKDFPLFFSKNGETSEIISIMKILKEREILMFSITSNKKSTINNLSCCNIYIPIEKEIDDLNLAPTISTSMHMMMGDIIATILSKNKKFTKKDFYSSHPSGYLGTMLLKKNFQ